MNIRLGLICFYFTCLTGCDLFKEEESHFVGRISLINPNNEEDKGYRMVVHEKEGYNANVLEDYIIDVKGDDSLLIVQGIEKLECNIVFYKILHHKGERPIETIRIDKVTYMKLFNTLKSLYNFHNEDYQCP